MEYYNNQLCITQEELIPSIMSASNLKVLRHRGYIEQVRRGCRNTPALYSVNSLPHRYRVEVYRRYPSEEERKQSDYFLEQIRIDGQAYNFYFDYKLEDGRHIPEDKQLEYVNSASILNACRQMLEDGDSHRIKLNKRRVNRKEFFKQVADSLPRLSEHYPNSLPSSGTTIYRKYNEYISRGYEALIDNRFNNKNALKIDSEVKESVLIRLLSHQNNLDNAQVADYYNAIARENGWATVSERTICDNRERLELITSGGRLGATNFRNMKTMQIKRSRPSVPFSYWTLDGWDCELLYQDTKIDKKGHQITTYSNRLVLEVVLDPFNDYPIGYAIGEVENSKLITEALSNAVKHSKELLGDMYRPRQLQCDHFAKKTMSKVYESLADIVTPARVKNAKSKVIEPYFKYLNKTYCQHCSNWSGFGVTTDRMKQPNSEALNILRKSFPTKEELIEQIHEMMRQERSKKLSEFMAMSQEAEKLEMSRELYLATFGEDNGYKNTLSHTGLRVSIRGERRDYDCFDIRFRELGHIRWTIKYDPSDLSEVMAISEDGSHRFMLQEKYVQPMALADRKEGDARELEKVRAFNKELEHHVTDKVTRAITTTEMLLEKLPQERGLLGRLAICDNKGQHKLRRSKEQGKGLLIEDADYQEMEISWDKSSPKDIYDVF